MGSIVSALNHAQRQNGGQAPLDPTPSPMGERVSRFEQKLQEGREENAFRGAEQSGCSATARVAGPRQRDGRSLRAATMT